MTQKILQIIPARPGLKITFLHTPQGQLPETTADLSFHTIEAWALVSYFEQDQILPLIIMPGDTQLTLPCEAWSITKPEDRTELQAPTQPQPTEVHLATGESLKRVKILNKVGFRTIMWLGKRGGYLGILRYRQDEIHKITQLFKLQLQAGHET